MMKKVLILSAALGALLFLSACGKSDPAVRSDSQKDRYVEVERGEFVITIVQEGVLDAIKHHVLRCPDRARFGMEIMQVVEDQTRVTNNQVIARFVDEKYIDAREDMLQEIDEQEKTLLLEKENVQMDDAKSVSDIKACVDRVQDQRASLRKYVEQDAVMKRKDLNRAIAAQQLGVEAAREKVSAQALLLSDARMSEKEKVSTYETQLDDAQNGLESAQRNLDKARYDLRIFRQYDHPRQMRQLEQAKEQADMALANQLIRVKGTTLQGQRKISSSARRLTKQKYDLEQIEQELESLIIRAPTAGLVTLGDPRQRQRGGSEKEIKIGVKMNQNEVLGSIPDLSRFVVNMNLPELFRSRIKMGQSAKLSLNALPDLQFGGEVKSIDDMASRLVYWDSSSPKIYKTEIQTDCTDPRLMPGMTVTIEVKVETVRDCLYLPVESLYSREGNTYCRVKQLSGYEERQVETGRSSSDYAEIISGLKEGEKVLLYRDGV
jgi:hypothetical protein